MAAVDPIDRPFAPPLEVVLDLPPPPSTNALWRSDHGRPPHISTIYKKWIKQADSYILLAKSSARMKGHPFKIPGRFELHIVLDETHTRIDADNIKAIADYLRQRSGIIEDDNYKTMRRVVSEYGFAPSGCRVRIIPLDK